MKKTFALMPVLAACLLAGTTSAFAAPFDLPGFTLDQGRAAVLLLADDDDDDRRYRPWGHRGWHDDDRWDDDDDRWDDDDWDDDDDDDDDD